MISRRQVLQGGLIVSSLPLVASLSWAPPAESALQLPQGLLDHPSLYKVLYDERFAVARSFGADARLAGKPVHAFGGDVTDVWFHDLYPRWRHGPAAIAGLTAHGALFCLEHLARDVRMRVVHRAEHAQAGQETLYSWVIAPRV